MASMGPNELTALEALEQVTAGTLTSEALVAACVERIEEREAIIGAWEHLSRDRALAAAREIDRGTGDGLLRGIPIAVKDIFDTVDMPTAYGSPIYQGHRPAWDASCVAASRIEGAIALGKTVSTEFAYFHPGKTANPHNPAHTPGGSSSGSAAAVADHMVPLAFGSQTVGSTIRPASYCGIVGYKPSFGLLNRTGMRPLASTFDTVGLFARDVADIAYFASIMARWPALRASSGSNAPLKLGICRTHEWPAADEDTQTALETAERLATDAGAAIREIDLPPLYADVAEAQGLIVDFETAGSAAFELAYHRDQLSEKFIERAEAGLAASYDDYNSALSVVKAAQNGLDAVMDGVDMLLCPSAPGEAPKGLDATGDPVFNRLGTALRAPCLNIPGLHGRSGLPVGVQLIGRVGDDRRALAAGQWLQAILRQE